MYIQSVLLQIPGTSNVIFDATKNATPSTEWGYTFAVSLLVLVILGIIGIIKILWTKLQDQNKEYADLANSTARVLSEISMKLDRSDEISTKIDRVSDLIHSIKEKY